eukprot:m.18892 g.18892  ORF g.18892 m.18892 type:complete len:392 (-) comp8579_c0_seq1:252-1427(-)
MARRALPILLLNLNCEMLYVIEERLVAQRVDAEKSSKVRTDLVTAMFDPEFIDNLFKPQPMYDQAQLLSMLQHFSQASIIRLNAKSLSKLFDLMIMTVKYQFSMCTCSQELLAVTLTHLETVRDTLRLGASSRTLVDATIARVLETYTHVSAGTWQTIRHIIGCVLQDKHTRVALFQQADYQGPDGRFRLPRTGPATPIGREPGMILYGDEAAGATWQPLFRSKFSAPQQGIDYSNAQKRGSTLGQNLYQLARQGGIAGVVVEATPLTQIQPATEQPPPAQLKAESERPHALKNSHATALRGLDLLSRLVGGQRQSDVFPLLLFSDEDASFDGNDADDEVSLAGTHSILHVEASSTRAGLQNLLDELNDDEQEDTKPSSSGDDLLSMFDAL